MSLHQSCFTFFSHIPMVSSLQNLCNQLKSSMVGCQANALLATVNKTKRFTNAAQLLIWSTAPPESHPVSQYLICSLVKRHFFLSFHTCPLMHITVTHQYLMRLPTPVPCRCILYWLSWSSALAVLIFENGILCVLITTSSSTYKTCIIDQHFFFMLTWKLHVLV